VKIISYLIYTSRPLIRTQPTPVFYPIIVSPA
jgi:hypothetical protein